MDKGSRARRGLTRRDLLRKSAVAGGIVWTAPVVQTFAAPRAFAQEGSPPPHGDCTPGTTVAVAYVKYNVSEDEWETIGGRLGSGRCLDPSDFCQSASEHMVGVFEEQAAVVTAGEEGDERVCITIPDDCTLIAAAAAKEGVAGCDFTPDGGDGFRTVCFEKEGPGGGVSYVEIGAECCIPNDELCSD